MVSWVKSTYLLSSAYAKSRVAGAYSGCRNGKWTSSWKLEFVVESNSVIRAVRQSTSISAITFGPEREPLTMGQAR